MNVSFSLQTENDLQQLIIFMANFLDQHTIDCKFDFLTQLRNAILRCPDTGIPSRSTLLREGGGGAADRSAAGGTPGSGTDSGALGGVGRDRSVSEDQLDRTGDTEIDWPSAEQLLVPTIKNTSGGVIYLRKHGVRRGVVKIVGIEEFQILSFLTGQPGFPVVESSFHHGDQTGVVMRWMGNIISSPVVLDTHNRRSLAASVLEAVIALHAHCIAHLDIKLHNIVVDNEGLCTLIDFGHSRRFASMTDAFVDGPRGTITWQGPEVEEGGRYHAFQADVWSVGAVLAFLGQLDGDLPLLKVGSQMMIRCPEERLSLSSALSTIHSWRGPGKSECVDEGGDEGARKKFKTHDPSRPG
ncbi:kinase-like protein [Hymenopellis radicata]|nr:kinase-like protein [Hymenopellis radicata]